MGWQERHVLRLQFYYNKSFTKSGCAQSDERQFHGPGCVTPTVHNLPNKLLQ